MITLGIFDILLEVLPGLIIGLPKSTEETRARRVIDLFFLNPFYGKCWLWKEKCSFSFLQKKIDFHP